MREKDLKEGLADLAYKAESDHEVQMARAELYKVAKYAIKLHEMMKNVSEAEGLEGWVQSKITKAADYISSVYHHMDYETKFDEVQEAKKSKPDFLDVDKDGDKKEPMKKAVKDKESKQTDEKYVHERSKKKKNDESYKNELASVLEAKLSKKKEVTEKAKSKAQQKFMGMVHAMQKGEKVKGASPELKKVAKDMPKKDAKDYAKTKHKGLPNKVEEVANSKICKECGKPSYTTLDEEKQKGVDGKVCWKGYKRMGTKKKGGKTVDNCVKM